MDHLKNCHPKLEWGDNSSGGISWGDNSSGGISWGDNSTGGSAGVTIVQVIQLFYISVLYHKTKKIYQLICRKRLRHAYHNTEK